MRYLILLAMCVLFSCNNGGHDHDHDHDHDHEHSSLLDQAFELQKQATAIEAEIKPLIKELTQEKNSISVQGRELSQEEQDRVEAIDRLIGGVDWFEKNLVDVPGHDAPGHEGHNHAPKLKLTPEDMLIVQQEFLDTMKYIKKEANLLLKK